MSAAAGRMELHGNLVPSSSLDPYTRLLASIADIVTSTRQSLHQSLLGCIALTVAVAALLLGLFLFLCITSLFWIPLVTGMFWIHVLSSMSKSLLYTTGMCVRRVRDRILKGLARIANSVEDWIVGKVCDHPLSTSPPTPPSPPRIHPNPHSSSPSPQALPSPPKPFPISRTPRNPPRMPPAVARAEVSAVGP